MGRGSSDCPVERPVLVFGVPRTGTTLLSNLLATDPARR
jgi:LPS sulfotransferase NodH